LELCEVCDKAAGDLLVCMWGVWRTCVVVMM
jgi:hypothetical protein